MKIRDLEVCHSIIRVQYVHAHHRRFDKGRAFHLSDECQGRQKNLFLIMPFLGTLKLQNWTNLAGHLQMIADTRLRQLV